MFGKKKSTTEKIVDWIGERLDGHLITIAKKFGTVVTTVAVALVGTSAAINIARDEEE